MLHFNFSYATQPQSVSKNINNYPRNGTAHNNCYNLDTTMSMPRGPARVCVRVCMCIHFCVGVAGCVYTFTLLDSSGSRRAAEQLDLSAIENRNRRRHNITRTLAIKRKQTHTRAHTQSHSVHWSSMPADRRRFRREDRTGPQSDEDLRARYANGQKARARARSRCERFCSRCRAMHRALLGGVHAGRGRRHKPVGSTRTRSTHVCSGERFTAN